MDNGQGSVHGSSYPPVPLRDREIRLLHLQPGDEALDLQLSLSVASIDDVPQYEALSYTWGSFTSSIVVEECNIPIPTNLTDALKRLRLHDRERVLWADSICINQTSIRERNEQVAMMAEIYKKCTRCFVWLGSEGKDIYDQEMIEEAAKLLDALSQRKHLDQPDRPYINWALGVTACGLMTMSGVPW